MHLGTVARRRSSPSSVLFVAGGATAPKWTPALTAYVPDDVCGDTEPSYSSRMTKPVRSFGVKNVDFGGISTPSRAVRSISAMLTGRISTAAAASPPVDRVDAPRRARAGRSRRRTIRRGRARATRRRAPARRRTRRACGVIHSRAVRRRRARGDPSRPSRASVAGVGPVGRRRGRTTPTSASRSSSKRDARVQPVDRLDAELLGDELADERQRQLGRRVGGARSPRGPRRGRCGRCRSGGGRRRSARRRDPTWSRIAAIALGVGDPFDDVRRRRRR